MDQGLGFIIGLTALIGWVGLTELTEASETG